MTTTTKPRLKKVPADAPIKKLIQHSYSKNPYRLLVCCLLLNRTGGHQVRDIIKEFFRKWPSAQVLLRADDAELIELIRPLGFYNRRAKLLKEFAHDYLHKHWFDPRDLKGIGTYGFEAWRIVMLGEEDFTPTDSVLRRYLAWRAASASQSPGLSPGAGLAVKIARASRR